MKTKSKTFNPGSWSGKPYNFFGDYLWNKYKCRILKLPINAGLSCPNRDGTLSSEGCIFCSDDGSASPTTSGTTDIERQMTFARDNFRRSDSATRYLAYFQAFTNTYAETATLRKLYDTAIAFPGVTGLMIGTRPDVLDDQVIELIASYRKPQFELWVEIGMQTMHDRSLIFLNRGHDHERTRDAVTRAARSDIPVCAHIILGIPGESWNDMMETAREMASLPVCGVKFHHLHVIKGSALELLYNRGEVPMLTIKEYTSTLCDFIERLRPDILIHRLAGDRNEESLVAPLWGLHKGTVQKTILDEFSRRGTYQGFLHEDLSLD
ncbi:MAG: TIGR01212 family radical SAM protein [Spirochaetae bacterium HGW-Spirochaetae-1]|nr:MAG: TIGR01212 family radical SAM protein [Spirochaetae bacterium HGW-Spirochaetae-1]